MLLIIEQNIKTKTHLITVYFTIILFSNFHSSLKTLDPKRTENTIILLRSVSDDKFSYDVETFLLLFVLFIDSSPCIVKALCNLSAKPGIFGT